MKIETVDKVLVGGGALLLVLGVAWFTLGREGNLTWDDSDYLREGLHAANVIRARWANNWALPIDVFLDIRPKAPFLVTWIASLSLILGTKNPTLLILLSSVLPFGLLVLSVMDCTRRVSGARTAWLGVMGLAALPLTMSYGSRVMVETFLSIWIVWVYSNFYDLIQTGSRKSAVKLGLALGLLALTKLTFVLFLVGPTVIAALALCRRFGLALMLKRAGAAAAIMVVVAGPWYLMNYRVAAHFASFSSRYQLIALGDSSIVATELRLLMEFRDVLGWPLLVTIVLASIIVATRDRSAFWSLSIRGFLGFTASGVISASLLLLYPAYFDTRFLIPVCPVLAVSLIPMIRRALDHRPRLMATAFVGLVGWGSFIAVERMQSIPRSMTFSATRDLIDFIVDQTHATNIYNVGNCPNWNVCKSGFFNELRATPDSCFVLHDLSNASAEDVPRRLEKADAVIVIDRPKVPADWFGYGPGLNKGLELVAKQLPTDSHFRRLADFPHDGLPPLEIYVRVKSFVPK